MFTNKNLFVNPMVVSTKPPSKKLKTFSEHATHYKNDAIVLKKRESLGKIEEGVNEDAKKKPEIPSIPAFKATGAPLVQVNPLNSIQSLKIQKQMSLGEEEAETPMIESLFDVKGNSKFKNGKPVSEQSADESSDSEDGEKVAAPVFKSAGDKETKHAWPNPFLKKNGTSEVFKTGTSLWSNPFAAAQSAQNKPTVTELA